MVTDQINKWQTECLHVDHGYWPDQQMTNWVSACWPWLLTRPTNDKSSVCVLPMVTDQTNKWQTKCLHIAHGYWPDQHMTNWVSAHCTRLLTRPTHDKLVSAHCTYQSINLGQVLGSGICWPQVVEPRLQGPYWNTGQAAGWTPVHWTIFITFPTCQAAVCTGEIITTFTEKALGCSLQRKDRQRSMSLCCIAFNSLWAQ